MCLHAKYWLGGLLYLHWLGVALPWSRLQYWHLVWVALLRCSGAPLWRQGGVHSGHSTNKEGSIIQTASSRMTTLWMLLCILHMYWLVWHLSDLIFPWTIFHALQSCTNKTELPLKLVGSCQKLIPLNFIEFNVKYYFFNCKTTNNGKKYIHWWNRTPL